MNLKEKNGSLSLFTDLYQLTMAASYFQENMFGKATFSLFIRKYPQNRSYFVAAGLEDVLHYLEEFRFKQDDLDYLSTLNLFSSDFLHYLSQLTFSGEVYALPEGRIFFINEPIIEVTAPLIEAQIIETFIINAINLQTMIATKAARCFHAAQGRRLVDFSLRRTHGIDAGLKVARASYIAGFRATSNVLAGKIYGIPVAGTMAHSFVTSFNKEIDAFRAFARAFPQNTVFLIDTYDTIQGAKKAAKVGLEMKKAGKHLRGVRLDSGNYVELSRKVRRILDDAGLADALIFSSGGFDEYKIEEVIKSEGKVNAFGVGTKMGVSADAPYFDMAYKLVKYDGRPVLKLSTGKETLVDEKQVFREFDEKGEMIKDIIGMRDEKINGMETLLIPVMKEGRIIYDLPSLPQIQNRFLEDFSRLKAPFKRNISPDYYKVELSPRLSDLQKRVEQQIISKELGES